MKTLSIAAVSVLCFWACLSLAESGAGMGPASLTVSDLLEQHTDGAAVAAEVATEAANAEVVYEMEAETAVMAEVDADTDVADAEEADEDEAAPFDGPAVTTLAEVDAEAGMIAGDGSASYRFPGHRYGRRDDVSGGAGARKFIAPKGKGCYIELNNCPRYPSVPSGKPFADGWFHKVATGSGWGWFGGKSVQKRCLRRARDFHEYCHGTAATTVTATWRPTGATRSAPHAGCWISQFSCAKHPEYRGKFFDRFDGARSSVNKARCFQRAREYHKWCENPKSITTTAEYRPTGQTQDFPADRGCFIHLSSCPNHPSGTAPPAQSTVGSFRDHWGELNAKTAIDEAACFARAQQYHSWCGLHLDERVTAEFRPSGRTKSYPRDLMAPIDFTDVNTHGRVACKVHTASTLIVATKGGEGACEVPFSALKVPAKRSLAGKIISFDVKFLRKPTDAVGRHGGIYFGTKAEGRSGNHVYDWIDRTTDRGYRVYGHAKNDKTSQLTPANQQPHQHWTIIIREDGTTTFRAGDVTWESVVSAHELDHIKLGFWAWPGNKMKITNFNIRPYSKHYKFHNLIAEGAKKKGNVEFSAITNGVEIRSLGHEGAVSLPMTALGLPHHHSLANKRIAFDIEFTRGHGGAGKHGGIFFGASPKGRAGNAVVDWIETGAKTGYRMYWQMDNEKWDYWSPKSKHPDRHWEIAIDSNFRVQFTAGDTQWMSRLKSSVNDGHIGFWVYHGVTMRITNVFITDLAHDVCSSSPCHNGGNCKADGNDFTCKCAPGFSGADCSKALNRCTPEAIASCNGGKCVSHPKKYKCDCAGTGKHGKRCDGHKLGGWFRADNSAQVFIDDKELIAHSSRGAEVVEINSAANAGSTVTVKALNTNGKGMMIAWLKFRGDSLVTNGNWECSDDVGATWHKATVLGAQGEGAFGSTSNMPAEAKYIWSKNANSRNAWCRTVLPAQAFKAGDRVALPVKTKLSVFCAKSHPASTTTYYGTVCSNGGVKWTHYYTTFEEVRHELKGQMENCAKARAAADSAENSKFFGDCENAPTLLSEHGFVKTAVAAQIKGLQRELNPCADKPCGRHSKCEWNKDGPFPFKCTCAAGYAGTGQPWRPCRSVDVCATSAPCDHNARCHKTGPGKHECVCKKGFSGSGHKCHAVDACASNPSPCSPNAKCKSMGPGKYSCACHDGFKGNGKTCTEVDPCAKSPCKGAGAKCSKTGAGKFVCSCAAGAVLEDDTCHAADVCHPKPCAKHAKCTVGAGNKAICECKPNYKGDGKMCSAVNPCNEAGGKDLCGANSVCSSHAAGQHKCTCAKGFKSAADGKSCTAVDACDANPCAANAVCKATGPGAYSCTCKSGYIGNGRQCKVADACDAKPCSPYARCATTGPNKHTCTCKDGYSGDGTKCEAVDACKQSPCHAQATCRMTGPGTHVCACNPGFTGSGANCEEIDACKSNPCKNAACAKTGPGKYKCSCNDGFTTKGSTNPDACVEKNNCNADKSPCADNQVCRVTGPAQHKCECKFGFKDVNGKCEEIDRCVDGRPCSPNASCAKTGPGTFLCTCAKGYEGDGITCKPKNNCKKTPSPCHAKARCTSTGPEQHKCECLPGYDGDGVTACLPHDNCLVNPCPANSLCTVSGPGQHRCEARPGFAFTADKKATVEIDNCKNAKAPCSAFAVCAKTGPGTHSCTCKNGYAGDGVTCAPVDICKTGPCDKAAVCKSTGPGTFACKCKDGHFGDGTKGKCEEINLCTSKNPCDPHAECTKTGPAKAECTCLSGYAGDGKKCAEVDPCKATPFPCSANAVCTKTGPALHKCECKPGYKGDGLSCRFDTTELDTHDGKMRTVMDGIDKLIPAANRVAFDGHDAAQNSAIGTMHESLDRVSKHVDTIAATAERTTTSLTNIAKAMKAVHDNTIEKHVIHDGPAPLPTPLVDDTTALPKIGNIADKRQPVPRDAGVSRIAAAH